MTHNYKEDSILILEECAEYLRREPRTILKWIKEGKAPKYSRYTEGKRSGYLFKFSDVKKFFDSKEVR